MAGSRVDNWLYDQPSTPTSPTSLFGNPSTFTAAANQQGSDYDTIMAQYDKIANNSFNSPNSGNVQAPKGISPSSANFSNTSFNPVSFNPIAAKTAKYSQSDDVTKSLSDLSNLVDTGGYSDADKEDIRARDISPIRSIYANAQENVNRSRALGGGYSPGSNVMQARMSREEADQVGNMNSKANADIAQAVAGNKIAAASPYASASAAANAAKTESDRHNADIVNQINQFNSQYGLQAGEFNSQGKTQNDQFNSQGNLNSDEFNSQSRMNADEFNNSMETSVAEANANRATSMGLDALRGKASLYGTTPALTSLFGNQVGQAAQLGQNQQQLNNNRFNTFGRFSGFGAG